MTLFEFMAHIRTLGEFTNVHAKNLYARFAAGQITLEQIAATAPNPKSPPVIDGQSFERCGQPFAKYGLPKPYVPPEPELPIHTVRRMKREALEEDNILLLFGQHAFLSVRIVMEACGYGECKAYKALARLDKAGTLYHKQHPYGGLTNFYYLTQGQEASTE